MGPVSLHRMLHNRAAMGRYVPPQYRQRELATDAVIRATTPLIAIAVALLFSIFVWLALRT